MQLQAQQLTRYIFDILSNLLEIVQHVLRVDNSAVTSISTTLGTARLKHIEGKLLWLQQKVSMGVLYLKAVRTYFKPADIGTKGLAKNKHRVMCFLLGFTCDGEPVGERDFDELSIQIALKNEQKAIVRHIEWTWNTHKGDNGYVDDCHGSSTRVSSARHVLEL